MWKVNLSGTQNFLCLTLVSCWSIHLSQEKYMLYLTNRFHVAVRLFSNRSHMKSKCGNLFVKYSIYFSRERWIDQQDTSVGQRKFWVPNKFTFHISLPSLKFPTFIHLSLYFSFHLYFIILILILSTRNAIRFKFWMKGAFSYGGNLCPLWLVILKLVRQSIGDTLSAL